jgi:hypothetical protein
MKNTMSKLTLVFLFLLVGAGLVDAQVRTATVISERANLRETPVQASKVKQEVAVGTSIKVLDRKGAWYVVRIDDSVGWMHGNTFRFGGGSGIRQPNPVLEEGESPVPTADTSHPSRSRSDAVRSSDSGARAGSGRTFIRGPRGGCYYYSSSGRKVYVDRSLCN